jgi:hypothetical protein
MPGAEGNSPSFSDCGGNLELFGVTAEVRQVISPRNSGKQPRSGLHPISQRRPSGIKQPKKRAASKAGLSPTKKQKRRPEDAVVVRSFKGIAAHARDYKLAISKHNKAQVAADETADGAERNKHEAERDRQLVLIRHTEAVLASNQFKRFDASKSLKKSKLAGPYKG